MHVRIDSHSQQEYSDKDVYKRPIKKFQQVVERTDCSQRAGKERP